ncbi:MAG: L-2-hydroxyglutarate oxidase [Flavobacteriales bacterium]|nr:L-2-hydroxyglutarate oxidase [Flavobacteriales bacterium]MBT7481707.1 L-2-hydroxyglutarate oxidase [Flavobacteriales bacterium]
MKYDIAIVGGGIVGMSTAYKIQKKYPKLNLIILEKEKELAFHQTGRNSGVIHSGLYYTPGSYRAKNCVDGRVQLVEFAKKYDIKHDVCGKIVLAVNQKESKQLITLKQKGEKNGLTNLEIIDMKKVKEIEPYAEGVSALFVPQSGIIDYKGVTNKLAELIKEINSESRIETNCEVLNIGNEKLFSTKGTINASHSIFCGGLFSDRLAIKDNLELKMQIIGFRGDYYELEDTSKYKVKNLIYPVPNPEFPFLGIHFTRMTDGSIECGPNAVFTFKREGYKKTDFNLKDSWDALTFSGTWKLFINHWKFGLNEYRRAFSKRLFLKELKKMVPSLTMEEIKIGRSGVRAMALGNDGKVIEDFMIVKNDKNIHILNAPSPAATACLAIGDEIVEHATKSFDLNNK